MRAESRLKEAEEIIEGLCYQFAYNGKAKHGIPTLCTGGLSDLEDAFAFLGWDDPHKIPDAKCEIPKCKERATCGTPRVSTGKYVSCCGDHYRDIQKENEANP